ncbi:MAG: hypothetical protein IPN29_06585 [Saprospiraceae bacterium]|nr:hypothetical protein [Saprospiraceae bacterium]
MKKYLVYAVLVLMLFISKTSLVSGQTTDPIKVKNMIARYKKDARGPYLDIRWFCQDGSIRAARDPCPDKPGNQRARYKDEVTRLAKKDHIFFGQILSTTPYTDFWDANNANSRLIQYQLEQFLRNIDNGWINRRAQFYRGAVQYEDENNWGIGFYGWRLADSLTMGSRYFLLRQSALSIPHTADTKNAQGVRALSREISDSLISFQDLRIKIHNMPDEGDIALVKAFQQKNKNKIPVKLKPKFKKLLSEMALMYRPFQVKDFDKYISKLPGNSDAAKITAAFVATYGALPNAEERCQAISHTALELRKEMLKPMKGQARLALIDIVNKLEMMLNVQVSKWEAKTLGALTAQVYCLSEAAAGFGFLELWEWEQLKEKLTIAEGASISLNQLRSFLESSSNVIHWGTAMVWSHYMPAINVYKEFEPLAAGYFDDLVRSSVLLPLGQQVNRLSNFFAQEAGLSNAVLDLPGQSAVRGLNPGYAMGELVVVNEAKDIISFSQNKIYAFHEAPANLKPVAGIISVTEGNMVSHVQLLARNLGIPNAVISHENLEAMRKFSGIEVFFAVSNKGTVILKPAAEMDASERDLFKQKKVREEKISVPVERIQLKQSNVLNLREVSAVQSGVICGPKAANLGQLKRLFPDHVVGRICTSIWRFS